MKEMTAWTRINKSCGEWMEEDPQYYEEEINIALRRIAGLHKVEVEDIEVIGIDFKKLDEPIIYHDINYRREDYIITHELIIKYRV